MVAGEPQPFSAPVRFDEHGRAWLPTAHGHMALCHVHTGCALGWTELGGKALLSIEGGGDPANPSPVWEAVAFVLTPPGLRALIADLQAIAEELG